VDGSLLAAMRIPESTKKLATTLDPAVTVTVD
jgi:hypothetical protein